MKYKVMALLLGGILIVDAALACSPPRYRSPAHQLNALNSPSALMQVSSDGQFLLKMIPTLWEQKGQDYDFIEKKSAYGAVYKIKQQGELQQLWIIKNIHPEASRKYFSLTDYRIFIDNEGSIVKVANYVGKLDKNPIVLWLYKKGGLLKQYPLSFFVKNHNIIRYHTCGFADWFSQEAESSIEIDQAGLVHFKTIDGVQWSIKASTGATTQVK